MQLLETQAICCMSFDMAQSLMISYVPDDPLVFAAMVATWTALQCGKIGAELDCVIENLPMA